MKKLLTILLIVTAMLSGLAGCGSSNTEKPPGKEASYPADGDITVIITRAAGGGTDNSARILCSLLQKELKGSRFVPVNRTAGGGLTGMTELAKAKPDGHTLGMVTVELVMFHHQGRTALTYKDFVPVCAPVVTPAALIVSGEAPCNTLSEFVKYAKANPGKIRMGNSGTGSVWHIAALNFEKEFGVTFKHVPYPKGTADIAAAFPGKHIDAALADPAPFKSQAEKGSVKILGIMADSRSLSFPGIPTFRELGHPMTVRAWAVLAAPKDLPKERLAVLRNAAEKIGEKKKYREQFSKEGIDTVTFSAEACEAMMAKDDAMYAKLLKP